MQKSFYDEQSKWSLEDLLFRQLVSSMIVEITTVGSYKEMQNDEPLC